MIVMCDYCDQRSKLVTGRVLYPHRPDLYHKHFYLCEPCGAYVGCHKNSQYHAPLGRLANAELRGWKNRAHAAFDPLWQSDSMTRGKAYAWLAEALDLDIQYCHIGMFDIAMCQKVVAVCKEREGESMPF